MGLYDQTYNQQQTPWYGNQSQYTTPIRAQLQTQTQQPYTQQSASQISQFAWITNPGVVDMWPVAPGSEMTFINLENMMVYVKRVDEYNHPLKVKRFKLTEVMDDKQAPQSAPQINMEELKAYLSSEIDKTVSSRLSNMFQPQQTMRGDVSNG